MSLKYNEEFKFALRDIANNSFKLENQFGNLTIMYLKILIIRMLFYDYYLYSILKSWSFIILINDHYNLYYHYFKF